MSEENVEIVRLTMRAEASRDTATLYRLIDPDVEMELADSPFGDFAEFEPLRGQEEVQAGFRDWYAAFDGVEAVASELIDLGDQVISVFTYRARGRTSGVAVEFKDMAGLWTIREGKIVRLQWLRSRRAALEAAGLSE